MIYVHVVYVQYMYACSSAHDPIRRRPWSKSKTAVINPWQHFGPDLANKHYSQPYSHLNAQLTSHRTWQAGQLCTTINCSMSLARVLLTAINYADRIQMIQHWGSTNSGKNRFVRDSVGIFAVCCATARYRF